MGEDSKTPRAFFNMREDSNTPRGLNSFVHRNTSFPQRAKRKSFGTRRPNRIPFRKTVSPRPQNFSNNNNTSCNHENNKLLDEMTTLVHRYGAQQCRTALNTAAKSMTGNVTRQIHSIGTRDVDDALATLLRAGPDDMINIYLFPYDPEPRGILEACEAYYDSLVKNHGEEPTQIGRPEASRFLGLYFDAMDYCEEDLTELERGKTMIGKVLERTRFAALFQEVLVLSRDRRARLNFMPQIRDLVVRTRSVSSVSLYGHHFKAEDSIALGEILQSNQLQRLNVDPCAMTKTFDIAGYLTQCLQGHVEMFADASVLQKLDIDKLVNMFDSHQQQRDFLNVIGTLPVLRSFEFDIDDPRLLQFLTNDIKVWKMPSVGITCSFDESCVDMGPFFDAIVGSRNLRHFRFSLRFIPIRAALTQQIFDCVLSPTCSLFSVYIRTSLDVSVVTSLTSSSESVSRLPRSQLRRFEFIDLCEDEQMRLVRFQFVQKRHPFLYNFGKYCSIEHRDVTAFFQDEFIVSSFFAVREV